MKTFKRFLLDAAVMLLFTLGWMHLAEYIEHAGEWLVGAALLRSLFDNYAHDAAHQLLHRAAHLVLHRDHAAAGVQ